MNKKTNLKKVSSSKCGPSAYRLGHKAMTYLVNLSVYLSSIKIKDFRILSSYLFYTNFIIVVKHIKLSLARHN